MLLEFDHDGRHYAGWTREDAEAAGIPDATLDAAELNATRAAMSCTPRQARLALAAAGLLSAVETYIASADQAVQIDWEYASRYQRTYGAIADAATALGLDDAAVDALFADAMSR